MIDVGGPSMLRAAAKNFAHVVAVCRPEQYDVVLDELRDARRRSRSTRGATLAARGVRDDGGVRRGDRALVRRASSSSPSSSRSRFQQGRRPLLRREPAPARRLLRARRARGGTCSRASSSSAARSSRTTTSPTSRARAASLREFALPAVVIVKHANPCGVAVAGTIEEAYERALAADPVSAFGCVLVLNRPVDAALGARIAEHFVEVLLAPELRRRGARGAAREAGAAHPPRPRAPRRDAGRARLQARARRPARAGARRRRRGPRGDAGRRRHGRPRSSGATCSSPGASASTSLERDRARARTCRRSASAPAR